MKEQKAISLNWLKQLFTIPAGVAVCIKCLLTVWALSGESLSLMLSGYTMDVPVAKYFFTVLESLDGWGVENLFVALGLGVVYYLVRDRQKNRAVSILSLFFALTTVVGISYDKTGSWDCIFLFKLQFMLAVFVMLGYYFAYKNCILFVGYVLEQKKEWLRTNPRGKIEKFLFEKHSFGGMLLCVFALGLPWLIFYFPGTLQWDAHAQLWMYLGAVDKTGHYPVISTEFMGLCLSLGRNLFHSDSIGVFFYTVSQFALQAVVFSYANWVMRRLKAPIIVHWGALLYWAVFPYFPIWGYTMVKDSQHYIFVTLLVVIFIDFLYVRDGKIKGWQAVAFITSILGIVLTRNDGRYLVIITMVAALIMYHKHWKLCFAGILVCLLTVFLVENVYMERNRIQGGPIGEMLSIPLQQTARYLSEHSEELTPEEADVLARGFSVALDEVPALYSQRCSDRVKAEFVKNPDTEYLKEYFGVWFGQFLKHPDTYVQAFLTHIYGYFYPNVHNYGDYIGTFYIGNSEKWHDGYLDIEFAIDDGSIRRVLEHCLYLMEKIPVLGMLLSPGMHTYILLGECMYLLTKKKWRELIVFVPGLCVLLICLASPVNAYLRYIMPVMALLPVTVAWCYAVTSAKADVQKQVYDEKNIA